MAKICLIYFFFICFHSLSRSSLAEMDSPSIISNSSPDDAIIERRAINHQELNLHDPSRHSLVESDQ